MKPYGSIFTIRRADYADIEFIYRLINFYAEKNLILERSKRNIRKNLTNFLVAEISSSHDTCEIVGIISYYNYGKKLKEVRSLAVKKEFIGRGAGSALLVSLVKLLIEDDPSAEIFTLTYSPEFFKNFGFVEIHRASLPEKIWKDCQNCKKRDNCEEIALKFSNHKMLLLKDDG